jgi:hypothetical protein
LINEVCVCLFLSLKFGIDFGNLALDIRVLTSEVCVCILDCGKLAFELFVFGLGCGKVAAEGFVCLLLSFEFGLGI